MEINWKEKQKMSKAVWIIYNREIDPVSDKKIELLLN